LRLRSVNEGFDDFLSRLTPTQPQRDAGAKHRATVRAALESHLPMSNFYETGSFSHGTGVRGHSGLDVLVSIGKPKPVSSYTALKWVKDSLDKRFPTTEIVIRRPAVVARFGEGYETWEVIPAFLTGRGGSDQLVYDIPSAVANGRWIDSAPREHLIYVTECNQKPSKGSAKALARLVKAWKYYSNVPISSFYLEMRCAQHVKGVDSYIHVWDLCLLLESLKSHALAGMNDPSNATGRIYACSSERSKRDALWKLTTAARRARNALEAHKNNDPGNAFYYLDLLFGGKFPAR
jgi:Second Messenger Oligonucleotide or Dinucleotide Synthetase domain